MVKYKKSEEGGFLIFFQKFCIYPSLSYGPLFDLPTTSVDNQISCSFGPSSTCCPLNYHMHGPHVPNIQVPRMCFTYQTHSFSPHSKVPTNAWRSSTMVVRHALHFGPPSSIPSDSWNPYTWNATQTMNSTLNLALLVGLPQWVWAHTTFKNVHYETTKPWLWRSSFVP